ncbi:glycerol-3-phosphate 1-O-acyltransferase PlsY [Neisseriaceae bacterium PsAf]|nr:glycerol-3-phosphate 1-O-acyltransferase PlsY [Neisseriaceae bacterium PsAf]MCV2503090.1 glycerol-3-phosphate 1-O-acyltransferase PlsY [Neisseriaceae bacterium]
MNTTSIILIIVAYLLGSISFAVIVSRFFKLQDPRSYGSKNPGATNVLRSGNKAAALLTLLGDALKGWLIVFLCIKYMDELGIDELTVACVSVAVVLGHMFPIFFKFIGGKGVATAIGVIFALSWQVALIMCIIWLILVFATKMSSLAALFVFILCPFLSLYFVPTPEYQIALAIICVMVILRHKENIRKIINRQENKIGQK